MIHRAIFGSMERFIGILIENFKGQFPFWCSPFQVGIVPIMPSHNEYAEEVLHTLRKAGIRAEMDGSDRNMRDKIKQFHNARDPFIIILGDKEAENHTVSITARGNKKKNDVPLAEFVSLCQKLNTEHSLELELPE